MLISYPPNSAENSTGPYKMILGHTEQELLTADNRQVSVWQC